MPRRNMFAMITLSLSLLASATNLYVSSYGGNITTLSLTSKDGNYSLTKTGSYPQCGPNPSWLTIDNDSGILYCMNEGLTSPNGSLSTFLINDNGSLEAVQNSSTIMGPVYSVVYGPARGRNGIVLPHYTGSALSTFNVNGNGTFKPNQNFTFNDAPGPNPVRQEAPHPHEAITDPTGKYVLVPDLGADLVRVYSFDDNDLTLEVQDPLHAAMGSGPRHAVFYNPGGLSGGTTYMYLVAELASTVTTYNVTYNENNGGLNFTRLQVLSTYGSQRQPAGNAPAEILLSPDNRFVLISNRNSSDTVLPIPISSPNAAKYSPQFSFASANGTDTIPRTESSDSISTFRINDDGTLSHIQISPSGGSWPRSMSLSPDGGLLAVGLQYVNRTVVYERDLSSGLLGNLVASIELSGPSEVNITAVAWGR